MGTDSRSMTGLSVATLISTLLLLGTVWKIYSTADDRYNQKPQIDAINQTIYDMMASEKAAMDRWTAQFYQWRIWSLDERITYLKDKKDAAKLAPYEASELRRLNTEKELLSKSWNGIAENFGYKAGQQLID